MDSRHRELLTSNHLALVGDLHLGEVFLSHFRGENILNADMIEEITNKHVHRTTKERNRAFLFRIPKRGPDAFRVMVEALRLTDQDHLADLLDPANQFPKPSTGDYEDPGPANRDLGALDGKPEPRVDDSKPIITFDIQPVSQSYAADILKDEGNFRMSRKVRGVAVLLNIQRFMNDCKKFRSGSETDVMNLKNLFQALSFGIKEWNDLTRQEILDKVREESNSKRHFDADAFVFVIMSHGKKGFIYAHDGETVNINEELIQPFSAAYCPALADKPKVFIIQACQGDGREAKKVEADDPESDPPEDPEEFDTPDAIKGSLQSLDNLTQMLTAYATVPGYLSYRNINFGSWFIRNLVIATAERAHKEHLADILVTVNRRVGIEGEKDQFHRQTCVYHNTMLRHFHLLPGYYSEA